MPLPRGWSGERTELKVVDFVFCYYNVAPAELGLFETWKFIVHFDNESSNNGIIQQNNL
jgi:hypothetical protein